MINNFNSALNLHNKLMFGLNPTNEVENAEYKRLLYTSTFYGILSNIITGIFQYDNITDIERLTIDRSFFFNNYVGACKSDEYGFIVAPVVPQGNINVYGEYDEYNVIFSNAENLTYKVNDDNFVLGRLTNMPSVSDCMLCYMYASQLAEIKISVDNSIKLSRKVSLFVGDDNQVRSFKQLFDKVDNGEPLAIVNEYSEDTTKMLSFDKPTSVGEYYDNFRDTVLEFLSMTGLSELYNPNKKERLVTDEVNNTQNIQNTLLKNRVENRKEFINKINDKFNLDIEVALNFSLKDDVDDLFNIDSFGDDSDDSFDDKDGDSYVY